MMNGTEYDADPAAQLFDQFISAVTCKSILGTFHDLCDSLGLTNTDHRNFYKQLKSKLTSWKAKSLWTKLDKRASHRDYRKMEACPNTKVLIIGAGPCGMRMAIEVALLGGKAVVVEKRDRFSRNNVLHLWNYLIYDLKNLGAKKFFGKFCAGSIEHISIRQLQCILLKVALLLGVEVHVNVTFEELIEPPEDQSVPIGWRCRVTPTNHPVSEYQFDVLIGADGKRNTVPGFKRKEFRGKLAIAITANFINRNSNAEARVEEISGVAFIFNQKFFLDLKEKTSIDLENIVYYKDETHYFVMTAKKGSLLEKGVLKEDYIDTVQLLSRENVDQDALLNYAKEAADFSTNHQLPCLDYAVNHYGQADIAMFDFTSMFAAENACRALERHGHKLIIGIVGDSLLEPFWPTGSGCARGFLGVFDAAWMIKSWASGKMSPLEVIAERESIYQLLSQTTPENLHKNHSQYSIDPNTRYPNLNLKNRLKLAQVKHLYDGPLGNMLIEETVDEGVPAKRSRISGTTVNNDLIDSYSLLRWCQRVLNTGRFRNVHVVDFAGSWRNGLAFCALIHAFRPTLLDFNLLMESDVAKNNQLAFDVAEKELGVPPVMTGDDMAKSQIPDKLTLVSYISQLYAIFRKEPLPTVDANLIFCQQTGCYVRVAATEDGQVSTIRLVDNPFHGVSLASVSNQRPCPVPRSDSQLSYNRPGIPEWVKFAASQASMSEDSSISDTESEGTTADGSITIWKKSGRRKTDSNSSDDELKKPADKTYVMDWVKRSSRGWSDNSDSTGTDDEENRQLSVKALARFYDGPRGYPVSHRPRSHKASVKGEGKPVNVETSSDVVASLSETQIGNEAVILDDSAFKTFTQDDMDQFNPEGTIEGTQFTGDDLFKTLTQVDDLTVVPPSVTEANSADITVQKAEDVQEAKTESTDSVQSVSIDQEEECSGDPDPIERRVDIIMPDTDIDSGSHPAPLQDTISCIEDCSWKTVALKTDDKCDVDMQETKTVCDPANAAPLPSINIPMVEDADVHKTNTKSSEDENVASGDVKAAERMFVDDDNICSEEGEDDADVDSSDEETVVPLDFKSLKKKFSSIASTTHKETMHVKRRAKSSSQQPDGRGQNVDSMVHRYIHSYTGGKVALPGLVPSFESSTDDLLHVSKQKYSSSEFRSPGATQSTEQNGNQETHSSTSNTLAAFVENTHLNNEQTSEKDQSAGSSDVESASINFKASKRKFIEASEKESKKVDRRSSFRSPQYLQGRSYMDILKESHPQSAEKIALGHRGRKASSVDGDRKGNKGQARNQMCIEGGGSETQARHIKVESDTQPADGADDGKLEFIITGEYCDPGVVELGGTFVQLQTESSTDVVTTVDQETRNLPAVTEVDRHQETRDLPAITEVDRHQETRDLPAVTEVDRHQETRDLPAVTEVDTHQGPCVKQTRYECKAETSDEDTEDTFYDAEEFATRDKDDTCEILYQTAYEAPPDVGVVAEVAQDVLLDDDVFATAVGTQLASQLKHVSVSEDMEC